MCTTSSKHTHVFLVLMHINLWTFCITNKTRTFCGILFGRGDFFLSMCACG